MVAIDLNADLGETIAGMPTADDEAMFEVISSASIACGGHAGDAASMRAAVARAARFGVAVGAHPSFPDLAGFGRRPWRGDQGELRRSLAGQLQALADAGADIRYVKPHGELYHVVRADREVAGVLVDAIVEAVPRTVPVLGLDGEIARAAAAAGLPFVREAFLDRGYLADGSLVPRGTAGALLDDPAAVAARALGLARDGVVEAVDGSMVSVAARSLCVHGDSPAAVAMARAVRAALAAGQIEVRAPW